MLIPLVEYARRNGKDPIVARHKAQRGGFATAVKMGRDWFIDEEEVWEDKRLKSGKYVNWKYGKYYKPEKDGQDAPDADQLDAGQEETQPEDATGE